MAKATIDLRSDTVTRPSPGMRAAMAAAEVGDDVYGDDPTVNRLQSLVAERFGFERALFFASGTQSNLAALMAHCGRGDEYLVGQEAHTYSYEQGGAAVLGSIQPQPLDNEPDGAISHRANRASAIKPDDVHFVRSRLLALENTIGGRVLPLGLPAVSDRICACRGLATHLDGARLYNAIVKLGIDERDAVAWIRFGVGLLCPRVWERPPAPCCSDRGISSRRRGAGARRSAAACVKPEFSQPRDFMRWNTMSRGSRRTTQTRNFSPRVCAHWGSRPRRRKPTWYS